MFSCTLNVTHRQKKNPLSQWPRVLTQGSKETVWKPGTAGVARGEVNGGGRLIEIFLRDLFFFSNVTLNIFFC